MNHRFVQRLNFTSILLTSAFLAVFLFAHSAMAGTEVQITDDSFDQFDPYISGDKIVWDDWRNFNNPEIYMYDLTTHTESRITDNSWGQYAPFVSGRKIFLDRFSGWKFEK
jgi:beta propeller repeat protein